MFVDREMKVIDVMTLISSQNHELRIHPRPRFHGCIFMTLSSV
jgi:hypothetical protein